jgi:hypothetical protein
VDAFSVIVFGGFAFILISLILLGLYHPRSGTDAIQWRPTQAYEERVANEIDDLDQMLEATNARRRKRGEKELTEHDLHERVREDMTEAAKRREAHLADAEVDQLIEARNARRRKRGEPEMTREEVEAEIAQWRAS